MPLDILRKGGVVLVSIHKLPDVTSPGVALCLNNVPAFASLVTKGIFYFLYRVVTEVIRPFLLNARKYNAKPPTTAMGKPIVPRTGKDTLLDVSASRTIYFFIAPTTIKNPKPIKAIGTIGFLVIKSVILFIGSKVFCPCGVDKKLVPKAVIPKAEPDNTFVLENIGLVLLNMLVDIVGVFLNNPDHE